MKVADELNATASVISYKRGIFAKKRGELLSWLPAPLAAPSSAFTA